MSTPLKALIQERLRAKMVCRRTDYDVDDNYERDSDRVHHQPVDVIEYDITSRDDEDNSLRNTGTRGSTSRRSSAPQGNYPVRLQTHIDPSAYLVQSHHDDRQYPPSNSYASSQGDRQRFSRYPREQYRDTNAYDQQQHHQRDQRRRQISHHRIRELPPRHEYLPRHISRQPIQNRASELPWHRSDHGSPTSNISSTTRSLYRAASSPVHSPSLRAHRQQKYVYIDQDDYSHHRRDIKSSPRIAASSNSTHQTQHQDYDQRQHYTWKSRDQDSHPTYEVRDPSPTRHHDRVGYQTPDKAVRRPPMNTKQSIQTKSTNSGNRVIPPRKPQSKEVTPPAVTKNFEQLERHSPPQLDMEIIEPPAKTIGRTRVWDEIMSPESRLAAKAFVEKRQRRSEKGTPRTMATQRWLEVIDARASRRKAGV
ncbi:hypothetical protein F442_21619 [Phytophthora nicotianae P10297]|uniref:Uncharacterized protein n=2 Tax=Phytophthora nicotianae TaxID=4792 RepID=W2Y3H1_PHYNI|nr:hypothetical protein L915_21153 [Phytophthora nicotianae]ETL25059.1 hypothetical protein L916_21028 [Phytophthora nicotianae]ETL78278.1 hypothetical protein L917_20885 [Phytophthora nicotianae]ETM31539.1 hypothetical protein L914_20898 [Phytophthora nicotianae]ETP29188.1 hypothetical protein F442_21619 [Phytophthora nicotianae P10297]